jgi:hypothetical protein
MTTISALVRDVAIQTRRVDALGNDFAVTTDHRRIWIFANVHRLDRQRDAALHHGLI